MVAREKLNQLKARFGSAIHRADLPSDDRLYLFANPESMAAGLRTARWIARDARLIAVLGYMAELGPIAREEHERVGELVTRLRVDQLITVGEQARPIAMAAVREGLEPECVRSVDTPEDAAGLLVGILRPGDVVFLKGSRIAALERVADTLRDAEVPA